MQKQQNESQFQMLLEMLGDSNNWMESKMFWSFGIQKWRNSCWLQVSQVSRYFDFLFGVRKFKIESVPAWWRWASWSVYIRTSPPKKKSGWCFVQGCSNNSRNKWPKTLRRIFFGIWQPDHAFGARFVYNYRRKESKSRSLGPKLTWILFPSEFQMFRSAREDKQHTWEGSFLCIWRGGLNSWETDPWFGNQKTSSVGPWCKATVANIAAATPKATVEVIETKVKRRDVVRYQVEFGI